MNVMAKWGAPLGIAMMVFASLYLAWVILAETYTNDSLLTALIVAILGIVVYIIGERMRLMSTFNNDS